MRPFALIVRGPTAVGKSTAVGTVLSACAERRLDAKVVCLDHGWAPGESRLQVGPATIRYADLCNVPEPVLIVELAWGEPTSGANGATKSHEEWCALLKAERDVFLIRLSGDVALLSKRRKARECAPYERLQNEIHQYVDVEAGKHRFGAALGLDELVIPVDGRSEAEIAGVVLRYMRPAFDS